MGHEHVPPGAYFDQHGQRVGRDQYNVVGDYHVHAAADGPVEDPELLGRWRLWSMVLNPRDFVPMQYTRGLVEQVNYPGGWATEYTRGLQFTGGSGLLASSMTTPDGNRRMRFQAQQSRRVALWYETVFDVTVSFAFSTYQVPASRSITAHYELHGPDLTLWNEEYRAVYRRVGPSTVGG